VEDNTEEALGWAAEGKRLAVETPDVTFREAGKFIADLTPIVGDAIAAKEVWDEINKAEPNWALVGALGGATVVGLIPGVGDAAAKAIKAGAKKGLGVARRIEVDPNAMGSMGGNIRLRPEAPRFNEEALATAGRQSEGSREILVEMPIDNFLSAAKTGVDETKLAGTRALVADGTPFESVPSLSFKNNGDGTGQVTGHEGRHRALALKEQGDTTIPVRITSQGGSGPEIRWGKQQDPDDFDYVDNIPTKLIEEGGSSAVPMPESILNLRSNSPDKAGPTNLDAWSEGSYFKDPETGKPEQLYHGMGGTMRGEPVEFTGDNLEASYSGSLGPGTYLTREPDMASSFAMNQRGSSTLDGKTGGQVFPVYSNITKVVDDEVLNANRSLRENLADYIDDTEFNDDYPYEVAENLRSDNTVELKSLFTRMEDGKVRGSGMSGLVSDFLAEEGYEGVSVVTDKGFHEAVIFPGHGGLKTPQQNIKSSLQGPEGLYSRDSNDMRYAQGGVVQQMDKMYKEGGLATDGMDVDPVSGNDIPVGSNAEDVRDDVDAKLSSGEYVVPADVVKYLGVAQLEKLVNKAKDGLEDMAEDGRIGGEPVDEPEEVVMTLGADIGNLDGYATGGLVEGMDYNAIIDRVKAAAMKDPSITNMLKAKGIFIQEPQPQGELQQAAMSEGTVPAQAAPPAIQGEATPAAFAEGGMVYGEGESDPANYSSSYNPYDHTPGFSIETGVTGQAPGTPYQAPTDAEVPVCPEGYVWEPELKVCMPVEAAQPSQPKRSSGRTTVPATAPANPNAWMEKYEYSNPETLFEQSMAKLGAGSTEGSEEESSWLGSLGDAAKGLLSGGLAGGLVGKFMNTTSSAQVAANALTLRDMGRDDLADQLKAQNAIFVKDNGLELVPEFMRDGDRLAEAVKAEKGNLWSTDATQRVAPSTGGGSSTTPPAPTAQAPLVSPRPPKKGPSLAQKALQKKRDATKAKQAASVAKSEKAPTGTTKVGRSNVNNTTGEKKETYESKVSRGGGFAKGGLVSRRKPKK